MSARRFGHRRRRRRGETTLSARRAVAVMLSGAALLLTALVFDAKPLFVCALALIAVGAVAPAWVWCAARGAHVRRVLAADRVIEDQPLRTTLKIRRSMLGLPGAVVIDPLADARIALSGPDSPTRTGRSAAVDVVARFSRRGEQLLPEPSLEVTDPLGLARVDAAGEAPSQRVLVLPRVEPVRWRGAARALRFESARSDHASELMAAVDLDGLRPYRVGTPASRIHWPALARGQGLIERRLRADGDHRPLIVLDSRLPGADPELLDAAVRATASLALELGRAGGCGLLLPGDQRPTTIDAELSRWPAAYRRLALVAPQRAADRAIAAASRGRGGPVIYVSPSPSERLAAALTAAGGGAVLVVPVAELDDGRPRGVRGRMRPAFDVAGCRGFSLGVSAERGRPVAESGAAGRAIETAGGAAGA